MIDERFMNDGKSALELNAIQRKNIEIFQKKCKEGIYQWENYICECGNDSEYEVLAEKDRYGLPVKTIICKCCGLVMTNPRLKEESNQVFYETEYPNIYRAIENPDDIYFEKRVEYGKSIVAFVESRTKLTGKEVLEIGCAGGGIVKAFKNCGYHSKGVDLSYKYVSFGQAKGLDLQCCHSRELLKENKVYDLIILNHVLEHFTDLKEELKVVKKLLAPKGVLYVAVPGINDLLYSYDNDFLLMLQNAHIYNFTKNTLENVMKKYGFDLLYGNEKVEALFQHGEAESIIQNEYQNIVSFLNYIEENKDNMSFVSMQKHVDRICKYETGEVVIYGTGKEANKLMDVLGNKNQIKGFLTNDSSIGNEFRGYPILEMNELEGVKCVLIASRLYVNIIYQRIKLLEEKGITIIEL